MRVFALFALLVLAACGKAPETQPTPDQPVWQGPRAEASVPSGRLDRSHSGALAPSAAFEDPDGEQVSLDDFRGKPLLVNLWATWCAPCVVEMPTLQGLAAHEHGKLQILAISQDTDGRAKVEHFLEDRKLTELEAYIDPTLGLMGVLKVDTLPTTILYDKEGRELWRMTGIEDWQSPRAAALVAEAFNPAAAR